jgi:hypothetical protein
MKYINMFFYSMSVIFCQLYSSAVPTPNAQWFACVKAIQTDDVGAFEQSFSKDLLPMYNIVAGSEKPMPIALVHVVALSKSPNAACIMEKLLSAGQDPNKIKTFMCQQIVVTETSVQGSRGLITASTPLDIAVVVGNVPVVKALLQHNADPYATALLPQTSFLAACLKLLLCKRVGEDPLMHARAYLECIKEANATSTPIEVAHGTQEEYVEIVTLLERAQMQDDLDAIGRCHCDIL